MIPRGTTLEFEYLGEFEMKMKNILGHESGAHMVLTHEKKPEAKNLVLLYLVPLTLFCQSYVMNSSDCAYGLDSVVRCLLSINSFVCEHMMNTFAPVSHTNCNLSWSSLTPLLSYHF